MHQGRQLLGIALASLVLACAPAFAAVPASSSPSFLSQQEKNKAIAMRVFDEIFNQGKFQVANEIYAPDFVNHGQHRDFGLEEDQAAARWEKQACPDLKITVELMATDGDLVTVVWRVKGTNTAYASPLPATGVRIESRGITVWRIVDSRIREEWTALDQLGIVRQALSQLKWKLFGLLCAVVALLWALGSGLRRLRLNASMSKG
jgi:predicted ester cyclase